MRLKQILQLLTLLVLVCSCSDEVLNQANYETSVNGFNPSFSFDSIASNGSWRSYSIQQKFDACQIPDSIISNLSTEQLVELCASHPLNPLCYAYNNPMQGALIIMHNFNGFEELQSRSDAAEKLINFYENVNFTTVSNEPYPITIECNKKLYRASNIAFIEFMLASDEIPGLYSNKKNFKRLDEVSYQKFEEKLNNGNPHSKLSLNNSLVIQSKVALKANKHRYERYIL